MNRFNPAKLRLSKWTACEPRNREKHFLVIDLQYDDAGVLQQVELQAVYSLGSEWIDWRQLRDDLSWRMGWH
ncbi:MAG: TIGR02450 family Trp-rich protein [Pseudomonas sp.]|nr:TIGR02450 family Trp-rich protein [Pseudomonas sp.]